MQLYSYSELYALHNAVQSQFLEVQGWDNQCSLDTEDEELDINWRPSLNSHGQQLHATSEERVSKQQ